MLLDIVGSEFRHGPAIERMTHAWVTSKCGGSYFDVFFNKLSCIIHRLYQIAEGSHLDIVQYYGYLSYTQAASKCEGFHFEMDVFKYNLS